ncbi:MAG: acyl-CoA dehydrogenase family protein [Acidimicrobiales bacterium]
MTAAEQIADEIFAPQRGNVDQSGVIPPGHLTALADAGLYGAVVRAPDDFTTIVEVLARGCLATTFVWLQHHTLARRLAMPDAPAELTALADDLWAGRTRAGIVQAGLLPGPPILEARPIDGEGSWQIDGFSPWCTGWGMIDELMVAARVADDPEQVVWLMVPAADQPGLGVRRLPLQSVDATATVSLSFDSVAVDPGRLLGTDDYARVGHPAGHGLRGNGSLALGLATRCARLIHDIGGTDATDRADRLVDTIDRARSAMDAADDVTMPARRADAALLAVDAAVALVAAQGASAAMQGSEGEQAMREATFLLVFGSRPTIKQELLRRS